ncbi:zonular occludens toxin domain-containing protein [Vibrio vulnificus]|uniref:zonular occludens toxin domain-containing protein n=1 Tax=Vibrio vulnificus TaxID=672 RepID=UPI004057E670
MTVYFVTGKLGNGKSLMSVARIREAFERGVPVATNLDINLKNMLGRKAKNVRLLRVPDKPSHADLVAIGRGNLTYDEKKNGLLVLDECGTWFNSRTWNDKGRSAVIDWCLHARKLGWDIIFIVQNISIVDKQARLALGEHLVICRRLDRMRIPLISLLTSLLTLGLLDLRLPRIHVGVVKYGDSEQALTVDKWWSWGKGLYSAYDTKQAFMDNKVVTVDSPYTANAVHDTAGVYTLLPPFYTHYRYRVTMTARNIMRITKIYGKRFSRLTAFIGGLIVAGAISISALPDSEPQTQVVEAPPVQTKPLSELLEGYTIESAMTPPNTAPSFVLEKDNVRLSSSQLYAMGFTATARSICSITVTGDDQSFELLC